MFQENLVWIAVIGIVCALFCILVYIYIKDVETTKCFKQYEKSIDDCTRQIYQKDKKIKLLEEKLEKLESGQSSMANVNSILVELKDEMQSSLNGTASRIYDNVNKMAEEIQAAQDRMEDRLTMLEEKIKEVGYFPTNPNGVDEGRIIGMFKDGWSVDAIAKELRVGKGEVEFTLKLANI